MAYEEDSTVMVHDQDLTIFFVFACLILFPKTELKMQGLSAKRIKYSEILQSLSTIKVTPRFCENPKNMA